VESSVFFTVPSGDWVTVFSFDLTVPSLLTVLDFSLETWRSHPTSRNDNARTDIATLATIIRFFMEARYAMEWPLSMGCYPAAALVCSKMD
jgi:hypothetical protein